MTEVAVVGAGLMGHALALVFALGGHSVRLTDSNAETLERAPGLMATALATLAEAGEVDASWDRRERLSHAVRCMPVAGADGFRCRTGGRGDRRAAGRQAGALCSSLRR